MWGAVLGDIVGSVFEFNNIKTKEFPLLSVASRVTDDTICLLAVADALLHRKNPEKTLKEWGKQWRPVGFSRGFNAWIDAPLGTQGTSRFNGAVMKLPPVAFLIRDTQKALAVADCFVRPSHHHPESYAAAHAFIETVHACFKGQKPDDIRSYIGQKYGYDMTRQVRDISNDKFYCSCAKSVPEALICGLEATHFEDALRNAVSLGGDSDTLAVMAGAVAEARFGVPESLKQTARLIVPPQGVRLLDELYDFKGPWRHALFLKRARFSPLPQTVMRLRERV